MGSFWAVVQPGGATRWCNQVVLPGGPLNSWTSLTEEEGRIQTLPSGYLT